LFIYNKSNICANKDIVSPELPSQKLECTALRLIVSWLPSQKLGAPPYIQRLLRRWGKN
tara:strand:+ start:102 stop:278 length:177 start_codon:yes stop_codon:yes gene_type:complete